MDDKEIITPRSKDYSQWYLDVVRGADMAEVAEVVKAAVAELGATSKKDMGRVMKEVMARVKGQADGKLVSKLVGAALP